MKLIKKFATVIVTVSMCFSMLISVSAKAAICPPHDDEVQLADQYYRGTNLHNYLYSVTENLDGTVIEEYKTCEVDVIQYIYRFICKQCNRVEYKSVMRNYHNNCGLGLVE